MLGYFSITRVELVDPSEAWLYSRQRAFVAVVFHYRHEGGVRRELVTISLN
jgi:hypothetical protein